MCKDLLLQFRSKRGEPLDDLLMVKRHEDDQCK